MIGKNVCKARHQKIRAVRPSSNGATRTNDSDVRGLAMRQVIALVAAGLLSGCATIVEGTVQYVDIQISPDAADCEISQKGSIIATIDDGGGEVQIPKSRHAISIKCSAEGYVRQKLKIESSASGWGIVGCFLIDLCITDYSTGALNKYPKTITIKLKRKRKAMSSAIEPPAAAPTIVSPTQLTYGILLASYESRDEALLGSLAIWGKHPQILSGIKMAIMFGSFNDAQNQHHVYGEGLTNEQAIDLCERLQEQNEYCTVIQL